MTINFEPLDPTLIYSTMGEAAAQLSALDIFDSIDSTNQYLLTKKNGQTGNVCLAEHQTKGRGRRGRRWISPFGYNLYLSLRWHFSTDLASLSGLSLVIGIAIVTALESYGVYNIKLKWPNDLVYSDQKLGGILIETISNSKKLCELVIGIGVNLQLTQEEGENIDQPWTDIFTITATQPQRNLLAGLILKELFLTLPQFEAEGLMIFRKHWELLDNLYNKPVTISTGTDDLCGIAQGVDEQGNLLVLLENKLHRFHSGEVNVRLQNIPQ